jgi:hypothetical protein
MAKVHYADRELSTWRVTFPLCCTLRAFDAPMTRRTREVTCKNCLRILARKVA